MNMRQLRAIQAVAELGSVTAAASRLGLTQSAVSRIISAIEAELGLKLFDRYRHRLILNEHAFDFVARAAQIISSMEELEARARSVKQGRVVRLRIVSVPPFLHMVLPNLIAERVKANPHLCARLDVARRADLPDWINRRDFDIAVVGLPVERPEVIVRPLPPVEAVAVLPREHRLAKQKSVRLEDILAGPLVTHSAGPLLRHELDRALARKGLKSSPVIEAQAAWIVCPLVAAGAGLAIMDPFTATALASSGLTIRRLKQRIVLKYGVVTFRDQPLIGEAVALAEAIHQQITRSVKGMRLNG